MGFAISLLGGACLIFQDKFEDNDAVMATLVVFAKFGSAMSMCVCYLATPWIFANSLYTLQVEDGLTLVAKRGPF